MGNTGGERGKMRRDGTVSLGIQGETHPLEWEALPSQLCKNGWIQISSTLIGTMQGR